MAVKFKSAAKMYKIVEKEKCLCNLMISIWLLGLKRAIHYSDTFLYIILIISAITEFW
jgi:hypothetical protein